MFTSDIDKVISLQEDLRKRIIRENTVLGVKRQQTQRYGRVGNEDFSDASLLASSQLAPSLFNQQRQRQPQIGGSSSSCYGNGGGKTTRQFINTDITDAYRRLHDTFFIKRTYFTYDALPLLTTAEAVQQQLDQLPATAADSEVFSTAASAAATVATISAANRHNSFEDAELQEFLQQRNNRRQQQRLPGTMSSSSSSSSTVPVEDTLFLVQQRRKRKVESAIARTNRMLVMRRLFANQVDTQASLSLTSIEQFGDANYARTQNRRTYILNPLNVATGDTTNAAANNAHQRPQRRRAEQQQRHQQLQQQHPSDEKVTWGWENADHIVRPYGSGGGGGGGGGGGNDNIAAATTANKRNFDVTQHWTDKRLRLVDTWIGTTANEFMDNEQCCGGGSGGTGARRRPLFNNSGILDTDDETGTPLYVSRGTQQRITEFVLKRDNHDDCDLLNSTYTRGGGGNGEDSSGTTSTLLPVESRYLRYGAALASAESSASVSAISAQLFGDCANDADIVADSGGVTGSVLTSSSATADKRLPHLSVSGIVGSRYNYVERVESARLGRGRAGIDDDDDNDNDGYDDQSVGVCRRGKQLWRVPRFTGIRKFQNRLALMCVNTSRLLYTVDCFRFARNYDGTDDTLMLYALNYYLDFDIGIADRVCATRRRNRSRRGRRQQQPQNLCIYSNDNSDSDEGNNNNNSTAAQTLRKQHFAVVTHLLSLTGYEEYVFGLAYLLAFNVDVILGSEHANIVHRYTHKRCANFCREDSATDARGLSSSSQTLKATRRLFGSAETQSHLDAEHLRKKQRTCAPLNSEASSSRVNGYVNVFVDQDRWYVKLSKTPLFL